MTDTPPPDFLPHERKSPVTAPWEPIFAKKTPAALVLGLRIGKAHTNSRGLLHGGVIAALADNAMGLSCSAAYDPPVALVTVNLSLDYIGRAALGQWVAFETNFIKTGSTLAFASCLVTADGAPCAKASATFRTAPAR